MSEYSPTTTELNVNIVNKPTTYHTVALENLRWQMYRRVSGVTARTKPLKIVPILITYVVSVARKAT